jgi:tRNA (guanine-N7-)-methyltransferase
MRMRRKPNLIPRMERCGEVLIKNPAERRGRWTEAFPEYGELRLELGCGKGRFTCETALSEPDALVIGVERVADALVVAMERAADAGISNARFLNVDASLLREYFAPREVSRVYINFCDPWPGSKREKRRLTSPGFLRVYRDILAPGGEIHFKTDNVPLFEYSLETFADCGFELFDITRDLHGGVGGVMTDYEVKFVSQGVLINRCVAKIV